MSAESSLVPCPQCGAAVGEIHKDGCSIERCWNCGGQAIGCHCHYTLFGLDPDDYAPEELWDRFDREAAKFGGRLPWSGEYPGAAACREFEFWCRETPEGRFESCQPTELGAREDVSRLFVSGNWDREKRRWGRWDRETKSWVYTQSRADGLAPRV